MANMADQLSPANIIASKIKEIIKLSDLSQFDVGEFIASQSINNEVGRYTLSTLGTGEQIDPENPFGLSSDTVFIFEHESNKSSLTADAAMVFTENGLVMNGMINREYLQNDVNLPLRRLFEGVIGLSLQGMVLALKGSEEN